MKGQVTQCMRVMILTGLFITLVNYAAGNMHSPILVLATDNKFGSFTGEILKTEGFNEFQVESPGNAKVTLKFLKEFDVVILTEALLTAAEKEKFERYVYDGGNLIAFRPDKKLSAS